MNGIVKNKCSLTSSGWIASVVGRGIYQARRSSLNHWLSEEPSVDDVPLLSVCHSHFIDNVRVKWSSVVQSYLFCTSQLWYEFFRAYKPECWIWVDLMQVSQSTLWIPFEPEGGSNFLVTVSSFPHAAEGSPSRTKVAVWCTTSSFRCLSYVSWIVVCHTPLNDGACRATSLIGRRIVSCVQRS